MRLKKTWIVFLLVAAMVIAFPLSGCDGEKVTEEETSKAPSEAVSQSEQSEEVSEAAEDKPFVVGWVSGDDIYPFHIRLREAIIEFGEKAGMTVMVADAKSDVQNEVNQIETYITQGVDLIATAPRDPDGTAVAADKCWAAGIPYVSVCGIVNTKAIYAGSNDVVAGEMQAEYLAEILPENANVLYLTTNPVESCYIDRKAGLVRLWEELRPDITVLSEQNAKNRKDLGMTVMETLIQQYGTDGFDAVVGQNDDCVLGAIEAMKAANIDLSSVITVGVDGGLEALESIMAGELTATAYQDAYNIMGAVIEVAKRVRDGEDATKIEDQVVPFKIITQDNVAEVYDLVNVQ